MSPDSEKQQSYNSGYPILIFRLPTSALEHARQLHCHEMLDGRTALIDHLGYQAERSGCGVALPKHFASKTR